MNERNTIKACEIGIARAESIIEKKQKTVDKAQEEIEEQNDYIRLCRRGLKECGVNVENTEPLVVSDHSPLDKDYD